MTVSNLACSNLGPEAQIVFGNQFVDAIKVVQAVMEAGYMNERWSLSNSEAYEKVQYTLRRIGKCLPISAVAHSEVLRQFIFTEPPWTLFGLDRLDRAGKEFIDPLDPDPCDKDDEIGKEDMTDLLFRESTARTDGSSSLGISEFANKMMV